MVSNRQSRTIADLERTVRAIATEFKTDSVFIIGSQAILLGWPEAPLAMKVSPEIDAFPGNAKIWETQEKAKHPGENPEASEHINALFGEGSRFHETHGFYIDGVDENTAMLPTGRHEHSFAGSRSKTALSLQLHRVRRISLSPSSPASTRKIGSSSKPSMR